MSVKDAEEFLNKIFEAEARLAELTGDSTSLAAMIRQARESEGLYFTPEELKLVLLQRLAEEDALRIFRFCFSEPAGS